MEEIKLPLQSVKKVIGLECVDSTQSLAKVLALQGEPDGTLVLACQQTAGRGRYDRSFSSAEGGIYFTLILRPNKAASCNASLSRKVGEAVAETLNAVFEFKTKIKEPNDVLAWDAKNRKWKKVCGILIETSSEGDANQWILVGIGLNLNNSIPNSLREQAVSIKQLIKTETSKELFLDELLDTFWKYYAQWLHSVC